MAATGVDFVKVGFFPAAEAAACAAALGRLAGRVKLVAVLFADLEPDLGLLPALAKHGFAGAMLDTADKGKGRLLDHLAPLGDPRLRVAGQGAGHDRRAGRLAGGAGRAAAAAVRAGPFRVPRRAVRRRARRHRSIRRRWRRSAR